MKLSNIVFLFILAITFAFAGEVEDFMNNVNIQSNKILNSKSKNQEQEYYNWTSTIIDTEWVAKFVLGSYARQITPDELKDFTELYKKYLLQNYMPKLKDYNKQLKVVKVVDKGNGVFVSSVDTKDNMNNVIHVDFRIVRKNDKLLITDIIPEGISFIGSQRTDINSAISSNGFKNFMKDLKGKVK